MGGAVYALDNQNPGAVPSFSESLIQNCRKEAGGPEGLRDLSEVKCQLVNDRTLPHFSPECESFLGITVQQDVSECLGSNPGSLTHKLLVLVL